MPPLTQDRAASKILAGDKLVNDPVAAGAALYAGGIYCLDATGHAVPASESNTLKVRARVSVAVDNTGGSDGDMTVNGEKGVINANNSSGADEITIADIENDCYLVDDQTVARTDNGGARSRAGKVFKIEGSQVYFKID